MISVVTFYTQGGDRDQGSSLEHQMLMTKYVVEQQGLDFQSYSPSDVVALGAPNLVKAYPDEYTLPRNPGAHKVGLFAWKPFVIREALRRVNDGDTVFYIDCNITKYPGYRDKIRNAREMVVMAGKVNDFFIARESSALIPSVRQFCSGQQLRTIAPNSEFCKNFPLLLANNIICKNTTSGIEIVDEWLDYCGREYCIVPPMNGDHEPEYLWHTADQAALTLLIAKRVELGLLPWFYPGVTIGREYEPRAVDNSHIVYLRHDPELPDRRNGVPVSWQSLEVPLDDWAPLIEAEVSRGPEGDVILSDVASPDLHLMRVSNPYFERAWVKLKIVARPLPDCDVFLCVHHWSGSDIAIFDPGGRVLFDTGAVAASAVPGSDGYAQFDVTYPSLSSLVAIGFAGPRGWYVGHGRAQMAFRSISIEYSPMD